MDIKDKITEEITERLKDMFVDDYEMVTNAMNNINVYLDSINVDEKYTYNDFCNKFLSVSEKLLDSLSIEDIQNADSMFIMSEVMSIMVKYKIADSEKDDDKRFHKLLQHELKMKIVGNKGFNDTG